MWYSMFLEYNWRMVSIEEYQRLKKIKSKTWKEADEILKDIASDWEEKEDKEETKEEVVVDTTDEKETTKKTKKKNSNKKKWTK